MITLEAVDAMVRGTPAGAGQVFRSNDIAEVLVVINGTDIWPARTQCIHYSNDETDPYTVRLGWAG